MQAQKLQHGMQVKVNDLIWKVERVERQYGQVKGLLTDPDMKDRTLYDFHWAPEDEIELIDC